MRDRVCPVEDCTATVRFETVVVEVTARYRLHSLDEVDEFAVCPDCDAEVAGFYAPGEDDDDVELILDIDDDAADGADGTDDDATTGRDEDADGLPDDDVIEDGGERMSVEGGGRFDAPRDVLGTDT